MSGGGYYNQNQHQAYGGSDPYNFHRESSEPPQYMHQNYGYVQSQGFAPVYQNNPAAFAPISEEYTRQPAQSPYPTAPVVQMPEPQPPAASASQQPQVIIVQQRPAARSKDCCGVMCSCIDWLLTMIWYVILGFFLGIVLIGLAVWIIKKYRRD